MRVLVVDNYDSFVYNLVQYVGEVMTSDDWPDVGRSQDAARGESTAGEGPIVVRRNDAVTLADVDALAPDAVVVSPGPGTPDDAGISVPLFAERDYPTLGVCLGHQALCAAHGTAVGHAPDVVHGKPSAIRHDEAGIFAGLPNLIEVGRYHSLAIDPDALPAALVETAHTVDDRRVVMGVRHRDRPHVGVQFHPESILTDAGKALVANFLTSATARRPPA